MLNNHMARRIKETKETCPNCKGTGWEWERQVDTGGELLEIEIPCSQCNGSGYLTKEE